MFIHPVLPYLHPSKRIFSNVLPADVLLLSRGCRRANVEKEKPCVCVCVCVCVCASLSLFLSACVWIECGRERALRAWLRHRSVVRHSGSMASSHGRSDLRFADWMASLPQNMHTVPLTNMAIPGSHDSFSFYIDEASPVGPEQPETVQNFVSVFGTVAKKLMRKWLATQTMNFISQLEAGIRFFDLRISTKPRDPDNELFFAHGLFSATVREGLEQISSFLSAHAKEVVFLDFNHFYGVQNLHHEKLVAMLKEVFGEKLCPVVFAQEVTLKYLWEKEYQVLVFYHHPMALEVPFLWPGQMMPAPWANTTDPEKLVQFLQASVTDRRRKGTFFVSQVVLTPKASTVMKGVASGLRETITERALPGMMQWIRSQRPGESGINIITADFVELGEFISAVISLNYHHLDEDDDDTT